jgi:hypothetical protein
MNRQKTFLKQNKINPTHYKKQTSSPVRQSRHFYKKRDETLKNVSQTINQRKKPRLLYNIPHISSPASIPIKKKETKRKRTFLK